MPNCYAKLCKVMFLTLNFCIVLLSLPSRGAWIEIWQLGYYAGRAGSRSPRGERGLKFLRSKALPGVRVVAPLAGSVD